MTHIRKTSFKLMTAILSVAFLSAPAFASQYVSPIAHSFNQKQTVDPVLYPHQFVGQPYVVNGKRYFPAHNPSYKQVGHASWYGDRFQGKMTVSGETFDKNAMTAAHKTLPINSLVRVTNVATGQSVLVRINDRGPFKGQGIIDLSEGAARFLRLTSKNKVKVEYAGAAPLAQTAMVPAMMPAAPLPVMPPKTQTLLPRVISPVQPQMQAEMPTASGPQDQDENAEVVLTIKGSVYLASQNNTAPKAELIPAIFKTYKKK